MRSIPLPAFSLLFFVVVAESRSQTTVYSQNFTGGTSNPNSVGLYANYITNVPSSFSIDLVNQYLVLDANVASEATAVVGYLPQTYLLGVNDYISFSLDIRVNGTMTTGSDFRFGLFETSAQLSSNTQGTYRGAGYAAWGRVNSTGGTRFFSFNGGNSGYLVSNSTTTTGTTNDVTSPAFTLSESIGSSFNTYTFEVQNMGSGVARIEVTADDGSPVTRELLSSAANWNSATDGYFAFDTFTFGSVGNTGNEFIIDNLAVITSVPEPGTAGIVLVGGVVLFLRRRF